MTSSNIENIKDCEAKFPALAATTPFLSVIVAGVGDMSVVSTSKLTVANAAFLDLGTYPIFLARATTFSLKVELSIKTSFATMFALYEVIYVLYANTSRIDERLDPSKS